MQLTKAAITLLALLALSMTAFAAPPTTSPADTADQTQFHGPRGALLRWNQAAYDGDDAAMKDSLWFSDAKQKEMVCAQQDSKAADQRLRKALDEALGAEEESALTAFEGLENRHHSDLGMSHDDFEKSKKDLIHADLHENADSAQLSLGRPPRTFTIQLVKISGQWKIDHAKTYHRDHEPTPAEIAAVNNYIADVNTITAEVKAQKFKTRAAAWKRYDPVWEALQAVITPVQVTHEPGPRGPLLHFVEGLYLGDKNLAEDACYFFDEQVAEAAKEYIESFTISQQFRIILDEKFGREISPDPDSDPDAYRKYTSHSNIGMTYPTAQFWTNAMRFFQLQQSDDTASLGMGEKTFYLVKHNGEWKIDFDKTHPHTFRLSAGQLADRKSWRNNVESLLADIKAGKIKTRTEAWNRYDALTGNDLANANKLP